MCVYGTEIEGDETSRKFLIFFCSCFFSSSSSFSFVIVELLIPPVSFASFCIVYFVSPSHHSQMFDVISFQLTEKKSVLITSIRFIYGTKGIRLIHLNRNDRQKLRLLPHVLRKYFLLNLALRYR